MQPNSPEHEDRDDSAAKLSCSDRCDFPLNASERISEQALIFFTRRAADIVSETCFTVMTGDRHFVFHLRIFASAHVLIT